VTALRNGKDQTLGGSRLIEEMMDPVWCGFKEKKEKKGRGTNAKMIHQPCFWSRQSHLF